jgi:cell division septal protein FtsQ
MSEDATGTGTVAVEPSRTRVHWRLALLAIGVALLGTAPFWAPLFLRRLDFFRVRRVEIVGARFVPAAEILTRLRVDTTVSVWSSMGPLERRVFQHPQVRTVSVRRKLPGTLVVTIEEWMPIALVPGPKGLRAHDERGVPMPIELTLTPVDAPILTERDTAALRLLSQLRRDAPRLYDRVSEVRTSGDELIVLLANVSVRVMKSVTVDRFAEIEPVESDLARRQQMVAELDLRYRDQVIARIQ